MTDYEPDQESKFEPSEKRTADLTILLLLIKAEIMLNPDKAIELLDELLDMLKP